MKSETIKICEELKNQSHCKGCGDEIKNGTCIFCGNTNKKFITLSKNLEELLKKINPPFNLFAELVNIYDLEIPFVSSIVAENIETMQNFLTMKLNNHEYADMINMLSKDNASMVVNPTYFFEIAKKYFCGEIHDMDDETYLKFVQIYTKNILEKSNFKSLYDRVPKVEFVSAEEIKKLKKIAIPILVLLHMDYV